MIYRFDVYDTAKKRPYKNIFYHKEYKIKFKNELIKFFNF
jgi:hypothetical protein